MAYARDALGVRNAMVYVFRTSGSLGGLRGSIQAHRRLFVVVDTVLARVAGRPR